MRPNQWLNIIYKGGINRSMIDILVTPIGSHYTVTVQYNGKKASELHSKKEKELPLKFSKNIDIGLNFVVGEECIFCDEIFSSITKLSARDLNYLLTPFLDASAELGEDAAVYLEKSNITSVYNQYGFFPFLF